ncbi:MAG TPA: hypothetical protein VK104_07960 [Burkholderiaceae bacterium]|nr:hypothetical protein [Burkholderiaceae bacterium]
MSWRVLIIILLAAAGFSAWGGISLGHWLVSHGPAAPVVPEALLKHDAEVLDADGKPYAAQPPQPLVNGRQGVPEPTRGLVWEVPETSLAKAKERPPIAIATTTITMDEARHIASADGGYRGLADVSGMFGKSSGGQQPIQPVEVPPPPPAPPAGDAPADGGNWQAALRQELETCKQLGFFERPSCAWAARNKYCEPNNAWGQVRDCPGKSF